MTNTTIIASYGTLTISNEFIQATTLEFANDPGVGGVLIFTAGGMGAQTLNQNGTLTTAAYFGGTVTNFLPGKYPGIAGDVVTIQAVTNLFGAMDLTGTDAAGFDNFMTFAAESGDYMTMTDGKIVLSPSTPYGDTLTANEQTILNDMMVGLFGTAAERATLGLDPSVRSNPGAPNQPYIDLVVTAEAPVNPCFVEGTRILTARGEVAVEALAVGDLVITPEGEELPVVWIGRRELDLAAMRRPELVRPVVIERGALGEGSPARDLRLSPDHALLIEGVLVPAKLLVNWSNIREIQGLGRICYYHVELCRHAALFAEGAMAESFLDTGHKALFDNYEGDVIAPPALMQAARVAGSFAPLVCAGAKLDEIRRQIAARQVGIRLG
ncbi:Hint domain-containing protein [Acidocella sp.]|uniref:Hint domain-containing protein n=1 Tax=Acidocella sp. TaxID=50710 RepID=UPI002615C969|nr:Hint domain-containing protein [Acidocella sp.]